MQQFIFAQETVFRIVRPGYHVNVRMLSYAVKCRVPLKLRRRNLYVLRKASQR